MTTATLITNGHVSTMDAAGEIPNGAVLIADGVIKAVGDVNQFHGVEAEVIDAHGGVIMPGMVDTHRHTCASLQRGIAVDHSLLQLIANAFQIYFPPMTAEDIHAAALVGALDAIDCGVTTILDCCEACRTRAHSEGNMRGLIDAGIRAFFSYGMSDESFGEVEGGQVGHAARLADLARLQDLDTGLVKAAMGLSHPGTVPFARTADEIRFAKERGMLCCSHSAPQKASPMNGGLRERADRGLMLPGHVYIHMTAVSAPEWQLVKDTGGKVSIAPETEMQMGMGIPPLTACREHGIDISLSIDTLHGTSSELTAQLRLALQMQRCLDNEASLARGVVPMRVSLRLREALHWITRNGADALGLEREIGSLVAGKKADVIVVRNDRALSPFVDPLAQVLYSTAHDVDTVLIDGQVRKRDGVLVGHDVAALRRRSSETLARLQQDYDRLPPELGPGDLRGLLVETERSARVNFAQAYEGAPTAERGSYRTEAAA